MFSRNQQDILQAMGFVLYLPLPQTVDTSPLNDAGIWEAALGINIRRHLNGIGTEKLTLPNDISSAESKRQLWRQIRNLRRSA
jgi:hypothetical protein